MKADGQFYIDDKPYPIERSHAKVSWLLHLAGASGGGVVLVSEDGIEHGNPDDLIEITPGARFQTRKRDDAQKPNDKAVRYAVNGDEHTTTENPLPLKTILRNAGAGAAVDVSDLQSYYLENTADGRRYENLDDLVTVADGDNFLAIHVGSTPVA